MAWLAPERVGILAVDDDPGSLAMVEATLDPVADVTAVLSGEAALVQRRPEISPPACSMLQCRGWTASRPRVGCALVPR